ncbi:CYTH domain-containing protein [Thalassorhabdus alkalitolerans]|uniref:CYTH domain-containing protein n=1 Tax=Thalassorhabdus alkalitolerans TaxID=2282697 RepID=A0ABW0YM51_9BACI
MGQDIEIEGKNLVTKDEFERIMKEWNLSYDQFTRQRNTYFDTEDFQIKGKKAALRIREKNNQWMLTLKEPHKDELLETNQLLTEKEAERAIQTGHIPKGEVEKQLKISLSLTDIKKVNNLGTLTTYRLELPYQKGELVFDHSTYLDKEDYELEFEGKSRDHVDKVLMSILDKYDIPKRETPNKIQRFFNRKSELTKKTE